MSKFKVTGFSRHWWTCNCPDCPSKHCVEHPVEGWWYDITRAAVEKIYQNTDEHTNERTFTYHDIVIEEVEIEEE